MRNSGKLAFAYIHYYKKQAFILFLGICMSALLLNGIASLLYSSRNADYENAKEDYGNWAYRIKLPDGQSNASSILDPAVLHSTGAYELTAIGFLSSCSYEDEMHSLCFCYGDETYLAQTGRILLEGRYPQNTGEIALDSYALHNLDMAGPLGSALRLGGREYILTGILSEGAFEANSPIMAFLGKEDSQAMGMDSYCYLTFSHKMRAYEQFSAFLEENRIQTPEWEMNDGLASFIGAEPKESILTVFRKAITLPEGKLVYLLGTLENNNQLLYRMTLVILFLFGAFIISSIFRVMVEKRMGQYGMMEALGMAEKEKFASLFLELLLLFLPAYALGGFLGNILAGFLYQGAFLIDFPSLCLGFAAFLCYLSLCCLSAARRMRKYTQAEKIKRPLAKQKRTIVSRKRHNLIGTLNRRFLLEKRTNFLGVILSLSLGGLLFLCTNYVAGNARQNQIHAMQTDQNLYTDIQIAIEEPDLGKAIPKEVVRSLREASRLEESAAKDPAADRYSSEKALAGINGVFPISYTLGEMPLENGKLKWTEFYPEVAEHPLPDEKEDPEIMERYNGIATRQGKDSYRLKVNVYGYENSQFQDLSEYILEGSIHPETMAQNNQIVLKTLMDGGGYYDGIDLHPGDKVTLKVPKTDALHTAPDLLKFQSDDRHYMEKEYTIAALVSRCVGENDAFIGSGASVVSIILPQQRMESDFGIFDYQNVNISLEEGADSTSTLKALRPYIFGLSRCVLHDYSGGIERQGKLLMQKVYFFYGIAIILFFTSLLHAINSMKHQILARRYEFGVLRAMGITGQKFRKMLIAQGALYGLAASASMILLMLLCQSILAGIMQHVVRYIIVSQNIPLLSCAFMAAVNIGVCILAMLGCGRELLNETIVDELH